MIPVSQLRMVSSVTPIEAPTSRARSCLLCRATRRCSPIVVGSGNRDRVRTTRAPGKKATRPCPCGWLGAPAALGKACRCTPDAVLRYQNKLSGPLLDRIDLQVEVLAASAATLMAQAEGEPSAVVAARVAAARQRQLRRQGEPNALLEAARIDRFCTPEGPAATLLRAAAERLGWSGRRLHRCLKVARTAADLAGSETIGTAHVAEALQWQRVLSA